MGSQMPAPKDSVLRAFGFEEVRPVPYHFWFCFGIEDWIDECFGSGEWRSRAVTYMHMQHFGFGTEDLGGGRRRDAFGVVHTAGNLMHIVDRPLKQASMNGYRWPDPVRIADWDAMCATATQADESYRCMGLGFGLFERAWLMRGMENLLVDMIENPGFVEDLLDGVLEFHVRVLDITVARVPIEAYFGGDDWAGQRGLLMSPALWRRFIKPRLRVLVERCHRHGLPMISHSCGNVLPLADELIEIGMDGLESLQPEATDLRQLKEKAAGRMVLVGGLGVQSTLQFATPGEVRARTRELIQMMGAGGGYVLAPSKPLDRSMPPENVRAFIETALDQ
jgi:uroporphyrinogen decarboxylase